MARIGLRGASIALTLCGMQVMVAAIAAFVALVVSGGSAALAAVFGGVVVIAPTAWFALRVNTRPGSATAGEVLGLYYRAETGKLILMALGFWLGAVWFGQHFAPLMLTAVACMAMNWLLLARVRS